jgi:hypothetical protein
MVLERLAKKIWNLDDYVVGVVELRAGDLVDAQAKKELIEFMKEIKSLSLNKEPKVPIPPCDGCRYLEPYGKGRYGFCKILQKVVNTTHGCLQKEKLEKVK